MGSRRAWITAVLVTGVSVAAGVDGAASAQGAAASYQFSHEVVVDEQYPGFEPDINVGPGDVLYSSVPEGSSRTLSYLWTSLDHGNSFHFVPANIAGTGHLLGTCPQGGGDTEVHLDPKGNLFFSDLQNLSNLSNSVSSNGGISFTSNCAGAPNTPVDRMWYATQGSLGDPNFRIYEDYDDVVGGLDPNAPVSNQLVLTASTNGLTFVPVINANQTDGHCAGTGFYDCVTDNEGISGNIQVDPTGHVLIAHTTADGNQISSSRGTITGSFPTLTGSYTTTILDSTLCPDFPADTAHLGKTEYCGAALFATVAEDSAGHFYESFASQQMKDENVAGTPTISPSGPYEVFVAASKDGITWGQPVQVSTSGSNAFPWITAGSSGRVAVAWYHTNETSEGGSYTFDALSHGEFSVQAGISLDETDFGAASPRPSFQTVTVSEHPIKYGPICTAGTTCEVTQGDRSLGDYLQVNHDARGALIFSYVDDTSNYYLTGPTGAVANNGPAVVVRQIGGPSLIAGTINGPGAGPGVPENSVTETGGDAFFSADGSRTPASDNLDLTYAAIARNAQGLVVTMKAKSLASTSVSPSLGGTTGEWITRFTTYDPGHQGNGNVYYAGMESVLGGAPRFFAGQPQQGTETKIAAFDSGTVVPGSYNPANGTITIEIPFAELGGHGAGTTLYSATAFTATTVGSLSGNPVGTFHVVKSLPPFDTVIPAVSTFHGSVEPVGSVGAHGPIKAVGSGSASLPATGGLGAPLLAAIVVGMSLAGWRFRRRSTR